MRTLLLLTFLLLLRSSQSIVLTGTCDLDRQCASGSCCALSQWLQGLRICTPLGQQADACVPISRKVPYSGKRQSHMCPCAASLRCARSGGSSFRCTRNFKNMAFQ